MKYIEMTLVTIVGFCSGHVVGLGLLGLLVFLTGCATDNDIIYMKDCTGYTPFNKRCIERPIGRGVKFQ